MNIKTYADLPTALQALSQEQLAQQIQVADPQACDEVIELHCGIAFGTVGEFGFFGTRSIYDNKYHADDVVLLIDCNPFGSDGVTHYTLEADGEGVKETPCYGPNGPTKPEEQLAPSRDCEWPPHALHTAVSRVRAHEAIQGTAQ